MTIDGITYIVVSQKPFTHNGMARVAIGLRRPNGKKLYEVVRYEDGTMSAVV